MRILWILPIVLFALTSAGCLPGQSSTPIPLEDSQNITQQETSTDLPRDMMESTDTPVMVTKDIETQIVPPAPTLGDENMTSAVTPDEDATAQKLVELAKEHLAQNLGIPVKEIVVSEVKAVLWHDASLGCPKPGIDYIRVDTPGYSIRLEAGGETYNYHTDETKRVVLCKR